MKLLHLFLINIALISCLHAMDKLTINSKPFSSQELVELAKENKIKFVPSLKSYYLFKTNDNITYRYDIDPQSGSILACYIIAPRPSVG